MSVHAPPQKPGKPNAAQRRPQRWLLVHGLHQTVQRFAVAWAKLPQGAGKTFARTLAIGWLLSAALMLALVWIARSYFRDETELFTRVINVVPLSFHASIWVETPGNSVFLVPIMLIAAIVAIWWNAPLRALAIVATFTVIDTLVLIGWMVWDRERPTLVAEGIAAPGFHSFPSGHVAQTIAVYGLLTYFWVSESSRRMEQVLAVLICVLLVVAVGLARLCLGTHWPTDLVAGAMMGGVWLAVVIVALRKAEAR